MCELRVGGDEEQTFTNKYFGFVVLETVYQKKWKEKFSPFSCGLVFCLFFVRFWWYLSVDVSAVDNYFVMFSYRQFFRMKDRVRLWCWRLVIFIYIFYWKHLRMNVLCLESLGMVEILGLMSGSSAVSWMVPHFPKPAGLYVSVWRDSSEMEVDHPAWQRLLKIKNGRLSLIFAFLFQVLLNSIIIDMSHKHVLLNSVN